jgi:hypothetical protein
MPSASRWEQECRSHSVRGDSCPLLGGCPTQTYEQETRFGS